MKSNDKQGKILVLGAGNFGTALAGHLANEQWSVEIWARSKVIVDGINKQQRNPKYLSGIPLPRNLTAIHDVSPENINDYRAIVVAVPMQAVRETLSPFAKHLTTTPLLISAVKGIEINSGKFSAGVMADIFGKEVADRAVVLSGPSFAIEIAQKLPKYQTLRNTT